MAILTNKTGVNYDLTDGISHSFQIFDTGNNLTAPFGENWEEYTWGEVGQLARKLATGLKSLGLPEKSHIGLMSKNCREWIIADLAIVMAGYVSVPFFPNLNSSCICSNN